MPVKWFLPNPRFRLQAFREGLRRTTFPNYLLNLPWRMKGGVLAGRQRALWKKAPAQRVNLTRVPLALKADNSSEP